jgi:hypothetical protein
VAVLRTTERARIVSRILRNEVGTRRLGISRA